MADDHGSILTAAVRAGLGDKSSEKRKQAAAELEANVKLVFRAPTRDIPLAGLAPVAAAAAAAGAAAVVGGGGMAATLGVGPGVGAALNFAPLGGAGMAAHEQVARALRCLTDEFCRYAYPNRRKGGFIGLASMAIALDRHADASQRPVQRHVDRLLPPVLTGFSDEDPGVRYSACEAFYNIAKVARHGILAPAHLRAVFDGLCRIYADVDQPVKDGAPCLDRLVRDIVTECRDFKYSEFIPMLTTRIRVLNPSVLQLVLGWIVLLDSVPQVDMIVYLPQYLEGLFNILRSDNRDIRHSTEMCLDELLREIKSSAVERPGRARTAIADASRVVARCCRAGERRPEDNYVRLTALHWLSEFVKLQMQIEAEVALAFEESELCSAAPPESMGSSRRKAFTHSRASSDCGQASGGGAGGALGGFGAGAAGGLGGGGHGGGQGWAGAGGLRQLVPILLAGALHCLDDGEDEIRQNAELANANLRGAAQCLGTDLPVERVVDAVLGAMRDGPGGKALRADASRTLLLKCFGWAQMLFAQCPRRVRQPAVRNDLLEVALAALARKEDEVAVVALRVIVQLVTPSEDVGGLSAAGRAPTPASSPSTGPLAVPAAAAVRLGTPPLRALASPVLMPTAATPLAPPPELQLEDEGVDASGEDLFARTCHRIFRLMADGTTARCELIVRKLCEVVRAGSSAPASQAAVTSAGAAAGAAEAADAAERFFTMAARAVAAEFETPFASRLVQVLNWVLLTSRETRGLRARLRADALASPRPGGPPGAGAAPAHLLQLLRSWFHCPVSTLALCLWLHWFELAAEVTARLARMELTEELYKQLGSLVQLLESPIFGRVRLQLLDTRRNPALLRSMLGLLALLPQESSLRRRLDIVETALLLDRAVARGARPRGAPSARRAPGDAGAGGAGGAAWALRRFDAVADAHGRHACLL